MRARSLAFRVAAALLALSACSEDTAGPTAGVLTVNLATPNPDDGAVLFTVSGPGIDSVAASGLQLYSGRLDPKTVRVILTGNVTAGPIAQVYIADTRRSGSYTVTLDQIAARGSYQQRDPAAYTLTLAP
jgi:hypothetical protein